MPVVTVDVVRVSTAANDARVKLLPPLQLSEVPMLLLKVYNAFLHEPGMLPLPLLVVEILLLLL